MSSQTLEQERAADAWQKAQGQGSDYKNLAKGAPALIMNSGLLQVMAFLEDKGKPHHKDLARHLRAWLHERFGNTVPEEFGPFMQALMQADPALFRRVTSEAMAWLRWMRQMAAAAVAANTDKEGS